MIEFEVDMACLLEEGELDRVVLHDENGEHQSMTFEPSRGTCHDSNKLFNVWQCSECGATMLLMFDDCGEPSYSVDGVADVPNYCPNCGREVAQG